MKSALLATLAFLPCLALAQSMTNAPSSSAPSSTANVKPYHHQFSPRKQLAWLTAKLGLSETQQGQIKPLLVSKDKKLKAIHQDSSLTDDQKQTKLKALFDSTHQQIESFLTPAQVTEYEAIHQQQHTPPSPETHQSTHT